MPKTVAQPDLRNWSISTRSQSEGLYALALLDKRFTSNGGLLGNAVLASAGSGGPATEFIFNVNPKSIDIDEPFAVTITPTQDGGQFVERQGSIYKTITISGTTGLRPNQKARSLIPVLGVPNPLAKVDTNPVTGLPRGEASGFSDLIELRNLFRKYSDLTADPATSSQVVLVWQNGKEGEFYVVEPTAFKAKRDASKPVTTDYEIQLRTISSLDFVFERKPDQRARLNSLQNFNSRMAESTRALSAALNTVNAVIDRTVGLAQATINNIVSPARTLLNGLSAITTTAGRSLAIPKNSVALLATNSLDFFRSLGTFQNEMTAYLQTGAISQVVIARQASKKMQRVATRLVTEDTLFSPSLSGQFARRSAAYRDASNDGRPPRTGGSPTAMQNVAASSASALATVNGSDTIFAAAQRLLGDQARWKELVLLNNLKPPYIAPTGDGINVLRPGDTILFPSAVNLQQSNVATSTAHQAESALVARLGRDICLRTDDTASAVRLFDIATNTRGDMATIEGVENMTQAVQIKFNTEQNTLPLHPDFGILAPIGRKVILRSLIGHQLNARASLLADSRITNVRTLQFTTDGNVLNVSASLDITGVDQAVSVSFDSIR